MHLFAVSSAMLSELIVMHHLQAGNTPLHEAIRADHSAIVDALISASASLDVQNYVSPLSEQRSGCFTHALILFVALLV